MNKQQEPRLRFHGFTEVWQEKVLGEFVKSLDAGVSVNSEDILPDSDEFSVLKTSCLSSGIFDKNERKRVLSKTEIKRLKEELKDNSILMSRMNTPNLVGLSAYIEKAPKNTFLPDRLWQLKINNEQASTEWLAYYLSKPENLFRIQDNATGTSNSMKNITKNDVFQFEFLAPSLPEQTHLGLFFRLLDNQIAKSRAVLEKNRQLKKAMLAKMFPVNGEKIPKIRFKGFEGEWECRKFSEVAELRRGLTYSPLDISQNGIRVLRSSNIDEEYYIEKNDDVFVCERAVNIPLAQNGDILITAANGSSRLVGKHAIIQTSIPAVHGGFMLLARTENPYFLNASMSSAWYLDFIRIFVAGGNGAIGNLSIGDLNEQEILIPKHPEEQTAIGNFFRQLDETIALQSAEVEKLNQLKKGLLAAMLV
jgi:hypothetical protein